MRVFLDTNVILDYLLAREPFYKDAVILVDLCCNSTFHGIISSLTVVNCFYILRKAYPIDIVYDYVNWMIQAFDVSNIDSQVIHKAYSAKRDDFEDMVQYYSALNSNAEVIITRDKSGFANGVLSVFNVSEFLAECMKS